MGSQRVYMTEQLALKVAKPKVIVYEEEGKDPRKKRADIIFPSQCRFLGSQLVSEQRCKRMVKEKMRF